ncbi:MAG TPA: MAPEG family protein [Polyangia bacterium]|nr:MAPEG family protein [Polyangia bacterium]
MTAAATAMTPALWALVGWAAWAMLLVTAIVSARGWQVFRGAKRVTEFPGGVQHGGDVYWRLYRAHANTAENLPIVAVLTLIGTLVPVYRGTFDALALAALGARVVQSLVHVSSGSALAINVRFTAFAAQYVCFAWMIVELVRAAR